LLIDSAIARIVPSAVPPAGHGIINVIDLDGYLSCAVAQDIVKRKKNTILKICTVSLLGQVFIAFKSVDFFSINTNTLKDNS
jgi:hypothetical protein